MFANLEPEAQGAIISSITDKEIGELVDDLYLDDAVDMLEELTKAPPVRSVPTGGAMFPYRKRGASARRSHREERRTPPAP